MDHLVRAIFLLILTGLATAQEAPQPVLTAATDDAIRNLGTIVRSEPLTGEMSVGQFVDRIAGEPQFDLTLRSARQIGGPRWLGDQAVQVRLEIAGERVADALVDLARARAGESPIPPEALERRLEPWSRRTFTATGTSVRAEQVESLRPVEGRGAWAGVSEEQRRAALSAARADAVEKALEEVASLALPNGTSVSETLSRPGVRDELRAWLADRPVTEVRFRDNLQVEVTLAAQPFEMFDALRTIAQQSNDQMWTRARAELVGQLAPPVGRASVADTDGLPAARTTAVVPALPPEWVEDQLQAVATAPLDGSKLKAARSAEADALRTLDAQLRALPLSPGLTLGDAADADDRVADALSVALSRARTYKVDYGTNGQVEVRVHLNLRDAWDALRAAQPRAGVRASER